MLLISFQNYHIKCQIEFIYFANVNNKYKIHHLLRFYTYTFFNKYIIFKNLLKVLFKTNYKLDVIKIFLNISKKKFLYETVLKNERKFKHSFCVFLKIFHYDYIRFILI